MASVYLAKQLGNALPFTRRRRNAPNRLMPGAQRSGKINGGRVIHYAVESRVPSASLVTRTYLEVCFIMAEFLPTTGISYRLEQIIKDAEQRLIIISPFLRINDRIKGLLEDKDRMKIDIRVVYGKNELRPEENNWLASKNSIRTSFLKDLHAKCYLNEHQALVTSMNFYEFSQVNNYEMGILVSSEEDSKLYQAIVEESERIIRAAEEIRVTVSTGERVRDDAAPKAIERPRKKTRNAQASPENGFCIRCSTTVPPNPTQPYCKGCYSSWKRHENKEYEENRCHTCGKEHKATLVKPVCYACYKKYAGVFEFALT